MSQNKVFCIAEAGIAHVGRLDYALRLVHQASDAGFDAVKFQAFTPFDLSGMDHEKHAMLKGLALTKEELKIIAAECRRESIEFMCTPMGIEWVDFLVKDLHVKRFKIGSAQAGDRSFVEYVAECGLPVIISNGMCDSNVFVDSIRILQKENCDVTALYCVSKYPTEDADVILENMIALRERTGVKVGLSSHCPSIWPTVAAVYAGAMVTENHITLYGVSHPDEPSSLRGNQLNALVREIRYAETHQRTQ